jgi:hypothetical protein
MAIEERPKFDGFNRACDSNEIDVSDFHHEKPDEPRISALREITNDEPDEMKGQRIQFVLFVNSIRIKLVCLISTMKNMTNEQFQSQVGSGDATILKIYEAICDQSGKLGLRSTVLPFACRALFLRTPDSRRPPGTERGVVFGPLRIDCQKKQAFASR